MGSLGAFLQTLLCMQHAAIDQHCCALTSFGQTNGLQQYSNLPLVGMQICIALWVFILGACFGSFLNVVIYRLPAGMSLGKPKSRCPRCETPLAARDNIPVLGWLLLRGRCRYCHLPIAARYPIIEATCGLIFLALLFGELLVGGANLPRRVPDHFHVNSGFWLVWFMKWDLSGLYLYHCCLMITVLAVCMIGYDREPPVRRLRWFGILVGVVFGTMWSDLRPVPACPYLPTMLDLEWGIRWIDPLISPGAEYWTGVTLVGLLDGLAGVAVGAAMGMLACWQMGPPDVSASAPSPILAIRDGFVLAGAFLGWQAVGTLGLFVLPLLVVAKLVTRGTTNDLAVRIAAPAFTGLLLLFLLMWEYLDSADWMIGFLGWSFTTWGWLLDWMVTLGVLVAIAVATRFSLQKSSLVPLESTSTD